MANNIKLIKILNGEEIIAEVLEDNKGSEGNVKFKNPLRIVVVPSRSDPKTPTVAFAPWSEFSDQKEFVLDRKHILMLTSPIQEFINQYNSVFGGIVAPSTKLILPGS